MNAHDPALESAGEQRRRRRRPDSGETDTGLAAFAAVSSEGPVMSRRELREQRARDEAAAQATQASLSAMPAVTPAPDEPIADSPAPLGEDSAPAATPSSGSVNRRSMRERLPEGPAGPAGRGERVPPPRRPVVKTPLAAQGVRGLDETGALSQVRSTRSGTESSANAESPVEVTGPLDWSSAVMTPVEEATPQADQSNLADEVKVDSLTDSDGAPVRRSVIKRSGATAASAAWAPVSGEGAGAAVPSPSLAPPPAASGVFTAVPKDDEVEDVATEDSDERRPGWMSPLGFILLAVLGVAVGAGLFFLVLK